MVMFVRIAISVLVKKTTKFMHLCARTLAALYTCPYLAGSKIALTCSVFHFLQHSYCQTVLYAYRWKDMHYPQTGHIYIADVDIAQLV